MTRLNIDSEAGFSIVELLVVLVILGIIGCIGFFVHHTTYHSELSTSTAASRTAASKTATNTTANDASATSSAADSKAAMQSDLNDATTSAAQSNQDLSGSNAALNDQSTYTAVN
jgi:prepilin-type N-terminal cleavage/methylation domain-containing protein